MFHANLFKTFQECQHYEDTNFDKMKYDLKGHTRPPLCQNHSSTFVYGSILMKINMNANIILLSIFYNKLTWSKENKNDFKNIYRPVSILRRSKFCVKNRIIDKIENR